MTPSIFALALFFLLLLGCAAPPPIAPSAVAAPTTTQPTASPTNVPPTITTMPVTPSATLPPIATPLPTLTAIPTPMPGGLYVDAAKSLGPVSSFALGANHGPWATITEEVQKQFIESGVKLIRFPGGNWGDENDIEAWQLDLFVAQAQQIQAEPMVSVRLLGGAPEKAVALVQYARAQNYNIHYWSIGNEPDLYTPKHPEWTIEYYNAQWRKFAQALKAADPSIKLVGPDMSQFTGFPNSGPEELKARTYLGEFLKSNGDLVDVVSVHRYPFPKARGVRPTINEFFANTAEWDTLVANLRALVRQQTGRDLPVAVTEFNSSWSGTIGGDTGMETVNNAIWLADVLGRLIRARVDIVALFSLQSGANIGGFGLFARDTVRPSYYTYQLWKHFGGELVYASSVDSQVSIYAARQGDTMTLMLINLTDRPQKRTLRLDHFTPNGKAQVRLLDEKHNAEDQPDLAVSPKFDLTLPPTSATLLTIPGKGSSATGSDSTPSAGNWKLIWSDEFDGVANTPPDPKKWGYDIGGHGWGNGEYEYYTDSVENAALDGNGSLVIKAMSVADGSARVGCWYGPCMFTSARLLTLGKFDFTYGRVEARIKIPTGQGIWPAFWMLGSNIRESSWPRCGEIDVMENVGQEPQSIHGGLHGPGYSGSSGLGAVYKQSVPFAQDYHTYAVEWEPTAIQWYVDGILYQTRTPSDVPAPDLWVFDHPFFFILNVAVGGTWPGYPADPAVFPQEMKVDYVRVYQKANQR